MEAEISTQGKEISRDKHTLRESVIAMGGTAAGFIAGFGLALGFGYLQTNGLLGGWIPQVSNVKSGFVVPSKLEIKVRDVDGEGHVETYAIYKGKQYFFKEDESGRPTTEDYFKQ